MMKHLQGKLSLPCATKFRGGSGFEKKPVFPYVKSASHHECAIHFYVITKTREIIRVLEIPDFCHTRVPLELSSFLSFSDIINFKLSIILEGFNQRLSIVFVTAICFWTPYIHKYELLQYSHSHFSLLSGNSINVELYFL